ncbi:MAG: pyruvate formate lyase family protein [Verrucomicrobiota bacterium]
MKTGLFTAAYQRLANNRPAERELACLRIQFPAILLPIQAGDLLAGRIEYPPVGFSPEPGGLGYYCQDGQSEFWRHESTAAKTRAACPAWVNEVLPSDEWTTTSGMAFPLYRMGGTQLDYGKLLRLGVPGLRAEIESRKAATTDHQARELYTAMSGALDLLADCCQHYARQSPELAPVLAKLTTRPPVTLQEAMQLMWLYALLSGTWNYGRMDVYLGPFLCRDLDTGVLTEAEARALIEALWKLMKAYDNQFNNRVIIGGRGRPDEAVADRFAFLALDATRTLRLNQPQLTLRFYEGQNPELMERALTILGEGVTFPLLYNDDVNIPAVRRAFNVSESEAEQYLPYGCGEYILNHRSVGSPNGVVNLLKCLEVALHNGVDPVTGKQVGPRTGDPAGFRSFHDVWRAYTTQLERCITALARQERVEYEVTGATAPFLFLSMLYDDCLETGRGIFDGGVRYLGGTLETYGNTNTADSLLAIRELVFERGEVTLPELIAACDSDFRDDPDLRRQLVAAPKYGNDDPAADDMARRVHEHVCRFTRDQAEKVGLHSYLVVIINNWANTLFGRTTAASADGRHAGQPMANANNPSPGMDRQGTTAFLNSLVQLDPSLHAGAVQNMKFSRSQFAQHRPQTSALLDVYFASGGAQAMITVVNRADLEAALREPEKWGHLMVRVGGFSARFIDLPPDVQQEILARTLNE